MFCGQCGAENKAGRKFCTRCGSALDAACVACGAELDPDDAFCGSCGTPVGSDAAVVAPHKPTSATPETVAERRRVSVLFVDLVGFTSYSEDRDAEEVRSALSDYFARAQEVVELHGGVVEKFIGDAVMAVWGTPIVRENDAERSVRAAIEIVASVGELGKILGVTLQARAGVYTGEAAVNLAAKGQGMVAGDMVNTASRLQSAAEPGSILVERSTYLASRGAIAFESVGELSLKGKQAPIEAWKAIRVSAGDMGFKPDDALEPAFSGREEEFRLLKDLVHATGREQKPRLASILGVGGIGKSRLVWEMFKYIDGLSEIIYWHQGRSPAYGEGIAFWALAEMVRMRARIAETDDEATAAEKLAACMAENIDDEEERRWLQPHLAHLLGLGEAAPDASEQLFAAWRTFFERIAEKGTVILVFEDLHWADQGLVDFIEHLMAWARTSPILIVTLARPELLDRRPNWGAGQRNFVSVHLEPLHDDDMVLLLKSIASDVPEDMRSDVVARAEGIPLYAVEMVRMLIDRQDLVLDGGQYRWVGGHDTIAVPDSLHSLIASRSDALPVSDRLMVQDAAVLGKTFTIAALGAVTGVEPKELEARLNDLVQREIFLVDTDPRSPERGQYGFVQSLIREVAYQTLSNENRKARHVTAARYFAALDEADLIDAVATHYVEAHRNARPGVEADELAQLARLALLEAASRAGSLGSHVQALALFERALAVTVDPAERAELLYQAGWAASVVGRGELAADYLQASIDHAVETGDSRMKAKAQARLGVSYFYISRLDDAERVLSEAIEELDDTSTPEAAALFAEAGRIQVFKGNNEQGERLTAMAMPAAERARRVDLISDALITRGVVAIFSGRPHEAEALLAGALKLAEEHGLVPQQLRAGINIAANQARVDPRQSFETSLHGLEMSRKYGMKEQEMFCMASALETVVFLCDWDWIRAGIDELEEHRAEASALVDPPIGIAAAFMGDLPKARGHLDSFKQFGDMSSHQDRAVAASCEATIAFVEGEFDIVLAAAAREAEAGAHDQLWPFGIVGRAALLKGDLAVAQAERARLEASIMQNSWLTATILTLDAGIAALQGDRDRATELYQRALSMWDQLHIPLCRLLCQMDFAIMVGGEEAAGNADEVEAYFADLGNDYFVDRLQRARL